MSNVEIKNLTGEIFEIALATVTDHAKAQNLSPEARDTLGQYAAGWSVPRGALLLAIVEGLHADVTRFGQSSQRRRHADPLHTLYRYLAIESDVPAPTVRTTTDDVATAERRFAVAMLTAEQRVRFDAYSQGYRDGVGSA